MAGEILGIFAVFSAIFSAMEKLSRFNNSLFNYRNFSFSRHFPAREICLQISRELSRWNACMKNSAFRKISNKLKIVWITFTYPLSLLCLPFARAKLKAARIFLHLITLVYAVQILEKYLRLRWRWLGGKDDGWNVHECWEKNPLFSLMFAIIIDSKRFSIIIIRWNFIHNEIMSFFFHFFALLSRFLLLWLSQFCWKYFPA